MHRKLAKEMEKKFWADLQERLDEVKQLIHCLTTISLRNWSGKNCAGQQ